MIVRLTRAMTVIVLAAAPQARAAGALLPSGYLTTSGSQIVDLSGHPVRLACAGHFEVVTTIAQDLKGMKADGFNCLSFTGTTPRSRAPTCRS